MGGGQTYSLGIQYVSKGKIKLFDNNRNETILLTRQDVANSSSTAKTSTPQDSLTETIKNKLREYGGFNNRFIETLEVAGNNNGYVLLKNNCRRLLKNYRSDFIGRAECGNKLHNASKIVRTISGVTNVEVLD